MIAAALGLLLPTAIVYWGLGGPDGLRRGGARLLDLGLAMVLAAGLTSWLWFVWLQLVGSPGWTYTAIETAVLLVSGRALRAGAGAEAAPGRGAGNDGSIAGIPVRRWAAAVVILLVVTGLISFAASTALHPHGSWDAVAIWNLHARYLAAGAARWSELMRDSALCDYHGDYPLLVPVTVARLWTLSGATAPPVAALVSVWFAAAIVLVVAGLVGCRRGPTQALLAAATLLGTSFFIEQSSVQYADLPLAACMVAAAVLLLRGDGVERRGAGRWLVLAGAATALAAWAKNEGVMFAAVIVVVRLARAWRHRGDGRAALADLVALGAGLLPGVLVVAYFKLGLAPENDLVAGQGLAATLSRVVSPGRYVRIVGELLRQSLRMLKSLLFVLPLYYLLMGPSGDAAARRGAGSLAAIYALMLIGYFAVYVTTPQPLQWHLNTSARRLLLQLWPGFVAAFFLLVAAPQERR